MSTSSVSTQTQQLTQSLSANTAERGDPKLKKKFLLIKPTYRPNPRSREGGIACHQPPPASPPGTLPPPSILTASGPDPPPPPVQYRNGAKIARPAAAHRLKSGAKTYFDCRCTTHPHHYHHQPPAALPRPGSSSPPSSPAIIPLPHLPAATFFRFFSACKNEKAVKSAIYSTMQQQRPSCWP